MKFDFYPRLSEYTIENALTMNGADIKAELSIYSNAKVSYMTILIDNRVLADSQRPEDIGASEDSTGLCFICVNESYVADSKVLSTPRPQATVVTPIGAKNSESTTNFPYSQSTSIKAIRTQATPIVKPLGDNEYAQREIESGKYTNALQEVKTHPGLENYFMNQLKTVDSKLHGIFNRNHALLRQYIENSETLNVAAPAFTILREEDNDGIMQIMEVGNLDYEDAIRAYFQHNRNFESWIQSTFGM